MRGGIKQPAWSKLYRLAIPAAVTRQVDVREHLEVRHGSVADLEDLLTAPAPSA